MFLRGLQIPLCVILAQCVAGVAEKWRTLARLGAETALARRLL